jgi:hypothetical protein
MRYLGDYGRPRKVDLNLWNSILLETGYESLEQISTAEKMYRQYGGRFAENGRINRDRHRYRY